MKTNKFLWIVLMTVCFTGFVSCLESGDETLVVPDINKVDIKNPEDIQNSLIIKDGKLTSGEMPASTSGNNNLSSSISSILINSGGTIFLPIIYNSGFEIESVYFQVLGVDGNFYSVKPTIITSNDKITYISVKIPEKIDNGTFNFIYKIKDKSNSISNGVNVLVEVTNVVASCENNHKTGQSGLTFTSLYLGDTGGKVIIDYDTYTVPDRIDIYQSEQWLTGTGTNPDSPIPPMCNCSSVLPGFVGKKGQLQFNYDPKKGKTITVVVSGCLNGGTSWEWTLRDAPECGKNNSSVYVPFAGKKVSKISISSTKGSSSEIIYTYDNSGTIATMKKGAYTYTYTFAGNNLTVKKGSEILYQCTLNNSGYISSVSNKGTTCTYNSNMYMTRCDYGSYYFTVKYDSKNNQSEVSTVVSGTSTQYYTYSNYENKTNIDLNAIVTNAFPYEAWFGEYGILSPFSLFGKRSPYLSNKDVYNNQHTFNISYTNTDGYPTKIVVTDNATVNNNGTTTYMITY